MQSMHRAAAPRATTPLRSSMRLGCRAARRFACVCSVCAQARRKLEERLGAAAAKRQRDVGKGGVGRKTSGELGRLRTHTRMTVEEAKKKAQQYREEATLRQVTPPLSQLARARGLAVAVLRAEVLMLCWCWRWRRWRPV